MSPTLHVIGAGLAGLSAAVAATRAGWRVALHEAAPMAGGRCRSFRCHLLDRALDNGSHLLLGANRNALAFAAAIGGGETLAVLPPRFPFLDVKTHRLWEVRPGRLPAGLWQTIRALGLTGIPHGQSVADRLGKTSAFAHLWKPLCEAILNTPPEQASAQLLARVLRTVFLGGHAAARPHVAAAGLSALFSAPAEATLAAHGANLRYGRRLTAIGPHVLEFDNGPVPIRGGDRAVLAVPPWAASQLLPALPPLATSAIVNLHFRLDHTAILPGGMPFLALVESLAQWLFVREDVVSVTISAAGSLVDRPAAAIAQQVWQEIAPLLQGAPQHLPPFRVIKERRATLAHTPAILRRRPGPDTHLEWLFLAGDWLSAPWPCTMEAAIASGLSAARLALGRDDMSFA